MLAAALAGALSFPATLRLRAAPEAPVRPLPEVDTGDLVFLDLECGRLCDAVAESTLRQFGARGPRLTHVGIVELDGGEPFIWEALPALGVSRVSLRSFLGRVRGGEGEAGGYVVGRLEERFRGLGRSATARARSWSGRSYDDRFRWRGPGVYCAKLVSLAFGDPSLFRPRPMYFGEEGSRARETWRAYFAARGLAVPDGQPGVSPLGIYLEGRERLFRRDEGVLPGRNP